MKSLSFLLFSVAMTFTLSFFPQTSVAMDIEGQIIFLGSGAHRAKMADAVIYFVPDGDYEKAKPAAYRQEMFRKRFSPRVLAVAPGSTITMPNKDRVKHNAFSKSKENAFDLDLYGLGEEKSYTVKEPGIVRVYCNVHYNMISNVLVLDTPYVTNGDSLGNFSLKNIPDTKGTLHIWHEQAKKQTFEIDPQTTGSLNNKTVVIKLTKNRISKHTNKFGKSYRKYKNR